MSYIRLLILYLALASSLFFLIGMYRPWVMLWWEDTQNRLKVIQVYGTLTVFFFVVYYVLKFFL